jgi:hypothetical protein
MGNIDNTASSKPIIYIVSGSVSAVIVVGIGMIIIYKFITKTTLPNASDIVSHTSLDEVKTHINPLLHVNNNPGSRQSIVDRSRFTPQTIRNNRV